MAAFDFCPHWIGLIWEYEEKTEMDSISINSSSSSIEGGPVVVVAAVRAWLNGSRVARNRGSGK